MSTLRIFFISALAVLSVRAAVPCEDCDREKNTWPLHGIITAVNFEHNTVTVAHGESKGLLAPGADAFFVEPKTLSVLKPDQEIIARIDKRKDGLWLISIGLVPPPPAGAKKK